jgi:hypothetical protein
MWEEYTFTNSGLSRLTKGTREVPNEHLKIGYAPDRFPKLRCNVSLALLGVFMGIFFSDQFFRKNSANILCLFLVVVLALAGESIATQLPHTLRLLEWIIPPASHAAYMMGQWSSINDFSRILNLAWTLLYAFLLMGLYVKVSERRLFV